MCPYIIQKDNEMKNDTATTVINKIEITDVEFRKFKTWIYDAAGINLSDHKKILVMGRLVSRMRHYKLEKYGDYFDLLTGDKHPSELQIAIDLLTTNETYFFREPKHFDFLQNEILKNHNPNRQMRIWSAASSTGEEAYSLAMVLQEKLRNDLWEITASDLSSRVLQRARSGHYSLERARHIPDKYLKKYCLKGVKEHDGTFLINPSLRKRVNFMQINLNENLPDIGQFDVIVIRNVMIYFNHETKSQVISRLIPLLKKGGYLFIGHSESLNGITDKVQAIQPAIYRKL